MSDWSFPVLSFLDNVYYTPLFAGTDFFRHSLSSLQQNEILLEFDLVFIMVSWSYFNFTNGDVSSKFFSKSLL